MISAFANTWKVPELRERILYTLLMIVIVRLGVYVTLPGVDSLAIEKYLDAQSKAAETGAGGVIGAMVNIFSGGGLQMLGIFALGIMPYISASIMTQLMTAVVPKFARLAREDGGRQKINQYTRFITIIIATVQGFMLVAAVKSSPGKVPGFQGFNAAEHGTLVFENAGYLNFVLPGVLSIIAGTLLLMWIGDQMTERGLGNGTSIIITVNIISALPGSLAVMWKQFMGGGNPAGAAFIVFLFAFLVFVVAAVVALTQAQRRITIQYAKRVVGRKQYGGQKQYLPLKVNYANVMPIIFATAILGIPPFVLDQLQVSWASSVNEFLDPRAPWYYIISGAMIFFFSYFWVATMFQPSEIAENLKRSGGYIPGVRPGPPTSKFLDFTMTRLTFAGAAFLAIIFMIPWVVGQMPKLAGLDPLDAMLTSFFGGTSLLILVGVVLDIMRQVETHLLQRHYDGFLRKGKIKGNRYDKAKGAAAQTSGTVIYLFAVAAILLVIGIASFIYKQIA